MWIAANEDGTIKGFIDCPTRCMRVPLNKVEELRKCVVHDKYADNFRYDKKYGYEGYWDISSMILDGRTIISDKEKLKRKIGFIPTWEMKPFQVNHYDALEAKDCVYHIVYNRLPSISSSKMMGKEEFSDKKNNRVLDGLSFRKFLLLDNKKIFISLPITGQIEEAMKNASETKEKLLKYFPTCEFVNPFDLTNDQCDTATCMGACIKELLTCDGVISLKGWMASKGCKVERFTADTYGIETFDIDKVLFDEG